MPEQPSIQLTPIGYVRTGYTDPAEAPPQAGEARAESGRLVLDDRFAAGLTGLRPGRWIWLISWLHAQPDEHTIELLVVPRSREATGERTGVFATRAPHRPNPVGLSLVRIRAMSGSTLDFDGVDLVDGTPVLDIKPWADGIDRPPEPRPD